MIYRKEIDGLRAVAVVPVMLFHAGFKTFSGGFVGVDVFFVISGYLITSIILSEQEAGTFTLGRFYERRARRILPALFLVVLLCIPFGWLWMPPDQFKQFAHSLVAVSLFGSNVLFWLEAGYFTPDADEKPLLHTWSLGIEEQYYVFFPLLLALLWRRGRVKVVAVISAIAVCSLALAQFGGNVRSRAAIAGPWEWWATPDWGFWLLPTRAWELMLGALLAVYLARPDAVWRSRGPRWLAEAGGAVGLILIGYAVFRFGPTTPFPSAYALIPTIGTALIIVWSGPGTIVGRLLSKPVIVLIGLISYSAYLWHQPLYAYARLRSLDEPPSWLFALLMPVAFVLAYFTWRWVERPFRNRTKISRSVVLGAGVTLTAVLIIVGTVAAYWELYRPIDEQYRAAVLPENGSDYVRRECRFKSADGIDRYLVACQPRSQEAVGPVAGVKEAILFGDSHANAMFVGLRDRLAKEGLHLVLLRAVHPRCEPLPGSFDTRVRPQPQLMTECLEFARRIGRFAESMGAKYLFISMRYAFRLYPTEGHITTLDFDNAEGGAGQESYRQYYVLGPNGEKRFDAASKIARTVEGFSAIADAFGGRVVLIGPVPEVGWNVRNRNFRKLLADGAPESVITTSYARFKERQSLPNVILATAATSRPNVVVVKPEDVFCNRDIEGRCVAQLNGVAFYTDDDHLSGAGAVLLADYIMGQLQRPH